MKFTDTNGDYNQSCFELAGPTEHMKNGNFATWSMTDMTVTCTLMCTHISVMARLSDYDLFVVTQGLLDQYRRISKMKAVSFLLFFS